MGVVLGMTALGTPVGGGTVAVAAGGGLALDETSGQVRLAIAGGKGLETGADGRLRVGPLTRFRESETPMNQV